MISCTNGICGSDDVQSIKRSAQTDPSVQLPDPAHGPPLRIVRPVVLIGILAAAGWQTGSGALIVVALVISFFFVVTTSLQLLVRFWSYRASLRWSNRNAAASAIWRDTWVCLRCDYVFLPAAATWQAAGRCAPREELRKFVLDAVRDQPRKEAGR